MVSNAIGLAGSPEDCERTQYIMCTKAVGIMMQTDYLALQLVIPRDPPWRQYLLSFWINSVNLPSNWPLAQVLPAEIAE